ncbi:SDR family NAD(P)-dependent oxidoreductase [Clostridium sp. CF012]|uniref:SDR family NAD(P)-dependent oxidoreductase n=1 Tax=Clostridium sp. CF012 TaxID=2843319 RepID=UPI001C0D877A|nr:SDR family NAD(P)-dependent oxidoreductase [Clostridium sp. CF012]MBU3142908.1 SDR family oxidoreductase [Clostridium sp. CF012]
MTEKKVLLITGAAIGIGFETAKLFASKGYSIAFNDHNEKNGENALNTLKELGADAAFFCGDATDEIVINEIVKKVIQKFGRIDVLVNNAGGLGGRSSVEEMTTEFWDRVLNLNLKSTFFWTREAIPYLKKSPSSSIVNITSLAAYNGGGPGATAYAVSKAGVLSFTRALAKELIPFDVRVNAISPGTIDTAFHNATEKGIVESWRKSIPAQRLGQPKEVADIIYFLASPQSSYLVGEVIQINGGQMML